MNNNSENNIPQKDTKDVLLRHHREFNRIRTGLKIILLAVIGGIVMLQWNNIIRFFNWLTSHQG